MQRVEPWELVGASASALALPSAWFCAVAVGAVPDVLDTDAGAGLVHALTTWREGVGAWPAVPFALGLGVLAPLPGVVAARLALAALVGLGGLGAWRMSADRPLEERVAAVGLVQLGPWTTLPLLGADLPGLAFAGLVLALSSPRLGVLGALFGAPVAAASTVLGVARRQPWLLVGALGLAVLQTAPVSGPGGALRASEVPSLGPAYGGEGGAWFPMPPQEARRWAAAAGGTGRWVHPRIVEGAGAPAEYGPDTPAPEVPPLDQLRALAFDAARGTVVADELRAIGLSGALAPIWGVLSWVCLRWAKRRVLVGLATLSALAGIGLGVAMPGPVVPAAGGADLSALVSRLEAAGPGTVMLFPPPEAPYYAGRISADRWTALLGAADRGAATSPALAAALGWRMEYGLDIAAAETLWQARDEALPFIAARDAGVRALVIDRGSVPPYVWNNAEGWIARRLGQPERLGELMFYELPSAVEAFGGGVDVEE